MLGDAGDQGVVAAVTVGLDALRQEVAAFTAYRERAELLVATALLHSSMNGSFFNALMCDRWQSVLHRNAIEMGEPHQDPAWDAMRMDLIARARSLLSDSKGACRR